MKANNEAFPVEVFSGMQWEAEMVKNLLENENVESFMNDEALGTLAPFYSSQGFGSVKVMVSSTDYQKAKILVAAFENNRNH